MGSFFSKEKIEEMKWIPPDFLEKSGLSSGKQTYICPCCQSGSGKSKTGIVQLPDGKWFCFAEGKARDIFDLVAISQGIGSFSACAEWLADNENIDLTAIPARKPSIVVEEEPEVDRMEYIQSVRDKNYEYLLKRGISIETQKKFWIGYDESWVHPKVLSNSKAPRTPRCIIPTSKTSYLARDTRDNIPDYQKNYTKSKVGKVHIFNEKVLEFIDRQDKDFSVVTSAEDIDKLYDFLSSCNLFIVEGEIDALSIIDNGTQAIGLGSTSNVNQLLKTLSEKHYSLGHVFFCCDNDQAGINAMETFFDGVRKLKLDIKSVTPVRVPKQYKDVNEFLIKDRQGFHAWLQECQLGAREMEILTFIDNAERCGITFPTTNHVREHFRKRDSGISM